MKSASEYQKIFSDVLFQSPFTFKKSIKKGNQKKKYILKYNDIHTK